MNDVTASLRRVGSSPTKGIATQLLALCVVPLVMLLALLLIAIVIQGNNQRANERAAITTRMLGLSDRIYDVLDRESQAITKYIKTRDKKDLGNVSEIAAQLPPMLRSFDGLTARAGETGGLYRRYRSLTLAVSGLLDRYALLVTTGNSSALKRFLALPSIATTVRQWRDTQTAFDRREMNLQLVSYDELRRRNQPYQRAALIVCIGGSVLTLLMFALFGTRIVRRLSRVARNAEALSLGESPLPISGQDEIASLDAHLRRLTARLRRAVDEKDRALSAFQRERQIADTLQRALLPQALPRLNGLHVHTAYVSAENDRQLGGDWYDLFEIGDGLVGISVGDVAGHGIGAAALMAAVRQSLRSAARASDSPATVLQHVNSVLCADESDAFVSALFATFDLRSGRLRYALAGHPPPIVVSPQHEARELHGSGILLGVERSPHFEECESTIEPSSSLVFYTDGLIEHHHEPATGLEQLLAATVNEAKSPGNNPADRLQERILKGRAPKDDSAVMYLVYSHMLPHEDRWRREWSFDARDEAAATRVKRAVFWQLADQVSPDDSLSVEIAYGELVANVARHTPGAARVEIERRDDDLVIRIHDEGLPFAWDSANADAFAESGRGMFLISTLAKAFSIGRHEAGNTATIVFAARRDGPALTLGEVEPAVLAFTAPL